MKKVAEQVSTISAGDVIEYRFVITNTGEEKLTDIVVNDPLIPDVSCPLTTLDPGESVTCSGSYIVTDADAEAGQVVNTVTVTANPPEGPPVSDDDQLVVPGEPEASMVVNKTSEHADSPGVGDVITYRIEVVNDGTVTLHAVEVHDAMLPDLKCPDNRTLAPGESLVCTGDYTVTTADAAAGQVFNVASVSAETADGTAVPDTSDSDVVVVKPDDSKPKYPQLPPYTGLADAAGSGGGANWGAIGGVLMLLIALSLITVGHRVNSRQRRLT